MPTTSHPYNRRYWIIRWSIQAVLFLLLAYFFFYGMEAPYAYLLPGIAACFLLFEIALLLRPDWQASFLRDGEVMDAAARKNLMWRVVTMGAVILLFVILVAWDA